MYASTAVIEDGRAMLVMGGWPSHVGYGTESSVLSTTQIVRPGQTIQPGPNMTGAAYGHCSITMLDGSVIVTGGRRLYKDGGSARTEVYNFTTGHWRTVQPMTQRRMFHSCTQVWVTPESDILSGAVTNSSVISIIVSGGTKKYQ